MQEEYNYNLTLPLSDLAAAKRLLDEASKAFPTMRLSRKPDRHEQARFYLSFPLTTQRADQHFARWYREQCPDHWDLFGPNYGVWGFR